MQFVASLNPTLQQDAFACWWYPCGVTWELLWTPSLSYSCTVRATKLIKHTERYILPMYIQVMIRPIVNSQIVFKIDKWYCILHLAHWNSLISVNNMFHDCSQLELCILSLKLDKASLEGQWPGTQLHPLATEFYPSLKTPHLLQWHSAILWFWQFFDEIWRIYSWKIRVCTEEVLKFLWIWKITSFTSMTLSNPLLFTIFPWDLEKGPFPLFQLVYVRWSE